MPYSYKDIKKRLYVLWYKVVRQNGSHVIFSNGVKVFPVPKHWGRDISPWVENKIMKNLGITKEQFKDIKT
jgi:predicted RNA binding protein YcfA (HicA-like mRNA interferase family)